MARERGGLRTRRRGPIRADRVEAGHRAPATSRRRCADTPTHRRVPDGVPASRPRRPDSPALRMCARARGRPRGRSPTSCAPQPVSTRGRLFVEPPISGPRDSRRSGCRRGAIKADRAAGDGSGPRRLVATADGGASSATAVPRPSASTTSWSRPECHAHRRTLEARPGAHLGRLRAVAAHPDLVADLARRLADALGLPCQEAVRKVRETQPQKALENSAQQTPTS